VNKRWQSLKQRQLSAEAQARVKKRVEAGLEELTLRGLRERMALTQAELGQASEMTQSELSRIEARDDHLTSTLRRYVEALGGKLEVTAVFGAQRVKLTDA